MNSEKYRNSISKSTDFLKIMSKLRKSILNQLNTTLNIQKKKLISILPSIVFCETYNLKVREKSRSSGNSEDDLKF